WIITYNQNTLAQESVFNATPNGTLGAFWMSSGGPAADENGNFFLSQGNGTFDNTLDARGFPSAGDFGNSFLKLSIGPANKQLTLADYFATFDQAQQNANDIEIGAGGVVLLPDLLDSSGTVRRLAVAAGKDKRIYVLDRDNPGRFNPSANNIYQEIDGA